MSHIVIAWLDPGTVTGDFAESVTRLAGYEVSQRRLLGTIRKRSGPMMEEGRNLLIEQFLATPADWIFMVDSDMVFDHEIIERLMISAEKKQARIMGALCFGINDQYGQFPTMYSRLGDDPMIMFDIPNPELQDPIVEVEATGMAAVLMHRTLFEEYRRPGIHPWFHRRPAARGMLGEDISFCFFLRDMGEPIYVDTTVDVGHIKPTIMDRRTYRKVIVDAE